MPAPRGATKRHNTLAPELAIKDQNREVELFVGRATTLFVLVVLMLGLLVYRLLELQLWNHDTYKSRSDDNRIRVQTLAPPRGMIFDRDGRLLADNQNASSLALVIDSVPEPTVSIGRIAALLELSDTQRSEMIARVESNRRPDAPLVVVDSLSEEQVARLAVNRHLIPGAEVVNRLVRHYPYAEIAAHAVGSVRRLSDEDLRRVDPVQYSATEFIGKRGVEAFYERALHGQVGYQKAESDALGRLRQTLDVQSPMAGKDLHLHLDIDLQRAGVAALAGRRGAVVALDPRNGGGLAMVSQAAYDPKLCVIGTGEAAFAALRHDK